MYQQTNIQYPRSHIQQHGISLLFGMSTHFCSPSLMGIISSAVQQIQYVEKFTVVNRQDFSQINEVPRHFSPPAQGWTAAGGLWWSAPARWLDRWLHSTAGSSWRPPSSQRRSPQRWGCTGPFSLSSGNGTSCQPPHSWMFRRVTVKWTKKTCYWCRRWTANGKTHWETFDVIIFHSRPYSGRGKKFINSLL